MFRLDLPPLRERREDIPHLAQHFLSRRGAEIADEALTVLQGYDWPGNVRELENVLERAAIVAGGARIEVRHLPADIAVPLASATVEIAQVVESGLSLPLATEALEKTMIANALEASGGNKSRAARLLQISERSLWYKLNRYKLTKP